MLEKLHIQQVLVEFHEPSLPQFYQIIDSLHQHHFYAFSTEANLFDPRSSEYSFVREGYLLP